MLTADIVILRFEKPEGFVYLPGQFVQFRIPHEGSMVLRSYSISSHPDESDLEFCVKIVPGGKASSYFQKMETGAVAEITNAKGVFVCRPEHSTQKVFIATGAGIAPIMSMVKDRVKQGDTIELLFGLRHDSDVFWVDELEKLKAAYPPFTYHITLSQPSSAWQGSNGRVTAHVPEVNQLTNYYMCGSVEMVKDVRKILLERGVNTKSVHFEIF